MIENQMIQALAENSSVKNTIIKPCRYCGHYAQLRIGLTTPPSNNTFCYIQCTECCASGPRHKNFNIAISLWNQSEPDPGTYFTLSDANLPELDLEDYSEEAQECIKARIAINEHDEKERNDAEQYSTETSEEENVPCWESYYDDDDNLRVRCSECKEDAACNNIGYQSETPYCPYCGVVLNRRWLEKLKERKAAETDGGTS